jgi:5-methylcytosine-specific restriction endonuclease McrA
MDDKKRSPPQASGRGSEGEPRKARPWSEAEERLLQRGFRAGRSFDELARVHSRSRLAIQLRLLKLKLITEKDLDEDARAFRARPKLTVELVPETCWYSNIRSEVSNEDWDRIRKPLFRKAGYRCEICGGRGKLHAVECHEVWHYDDARHVQTLERMIVLCPSCHQVKHIGLAQIQGHLEEAMAHLARVNGWDRRTTERYLDEVWETWRERSRHAWTLDLSVLATYGVQPPANHDRARPR